MAWIARGFDGVDGRPDRVLARSTRDIAPGAVVLLHEGAGNGQNVAILEQLLTWLDAEGYRTVLPDEDVQRDTSIVTA